MAGQGSGTYLLQAETLRNDEADEEDGAWTGLVGLTVGDSLVGVEGSS